MKFDNRPTQWHEFTVRARGGAVYVRVNPTLTYTRLEISATDSPGDLCPPTRQQQIRRVDGDKVYLAACSVGETYVELYTMGGTRKARYRVDVQRYTPPTDTPTPEPPTATPTPSPPTATATPKPPTATPTPISACELRRANVLFVYDGLNRRLEGEWGPSGCVYFVTEVTYRVHLLLELESSGLDPEVSLIMGSVPSGRVLASNDDNPEGSGPESLLGKNLLAGPFTVKATVKTPPPAGSRFSLKVSAASPVPHSGHHQEDRNVEYVKIFRSSLPGWASTVIEDAAAKWNSAAPGLIEICEAGSCTGTRDGHLTSVSIVEGLRDSHGRATVAGIDCGSTLACVVYEQLGPEGHMEALYMRIESPGWTQTGVRDLKVEWVNEIRMDNVILGHMYFRHLPSVVLHELGHTLGLNDLDARFYYYLMYKALGVHLFVPHLDTDYLKQVYRNHLADRH